MLSAVSPPNAPTSAATVHTLWGLNFPQLPLTDPRPPALEVATASGLTNYAAIGQTHCAACSEISASRLQCTSAAGHGEGLQLKLSVGTGSGDIAVAMTSAITYDGCRPLLVVYYS